MYISICIFIICILDIVSVEPKTGSPEGGTLITINGKHFTDPLDDIKVDISGNCYLIHTYIHTCIQAMYMYIHVHDIL